MVLPSRCAEFRRGDADAEIDVSDAVYLLSYLFTGGRPPEEPFAACGLDPTPDRLTCEEYAPCS